MSEGTLTENEELRVALMLAVSGLSWAVGHIEGAGGPKDNYAARTLERLEKPRVTVASTRKDER
jgi:hypothetical protein